MSKPVVNRTVRVDIEKLDSLMNLVSELIIAKNSLVAASSNDHGNNTAFNEQIEYLENVTTNLHESVMKVRMVPIESVVVKFPRMIRDLSKKLDKKMELYMTGEETELDRTGRIIFETRDLVIGYDEPLSKPLDLSMERGEKVALIGANGIGKTTLLKSILGLIPPLSGEVEQGDYLEIGYFEQEMSGSGDNSCIEEIWQEFPAFTQYEVRSALARCGLTTKHIESRVKVLSGGEQAKVRLCKLMNRATNVLLLDEPTNHLDVDAKDELKRALQEYKGSILMVCHEPEFYDGLATQVWDLSRWTTKI